METKKTPIREYIARRIQEKMKEEEAKLEKTEEEKLSESREEYLLK